MRQSYVGASMNITVYSAINLTHIDERVSITDSGIFQNISFRHFLRTQGVVFLTPSSAAAIGKN